jgi:DNA polymerase-3 subunit alpha
MCFLTLADDTGEIDALVFPDLYSAAASILNEDSIVLAGGEISVKDDRLSVICGSLTDEASFSRIIGNMKLCIKTTAKNASVPPELVRICEKYSGTTAVCFYLTDLKKTVMPKKQLTLSVTPQSATELMQIFDISQVGLIS